MTRVGVGIFFALGACVLAGPLALLALYALLRVVLVVAAETHFRK